MALVDIAHRDNAVALCREAVVQQRPGDELHVAYVMPYGHYSYVEPFVSEDSIKAAAKRAHQELSEIAQDADMVASEHVLRGNVGEQALLLAEKTGTDLLLLNAHRPGVRIHTLGSYATQIIRHAPCSVLVCR
ncbi:universal stress protein [uncultured Tateyamaria sp.]|uniref:universal stress protein n=1 Tax=uncultured Tateyamaria sp. TaxID=455651 RepID=UPI0026397728|nr:universal stress protein [uncultured Tateyamaria sp.]